jgi:hypothetical protein
MQVRILIFAVVSALVCSIEGSMHSDCEESGEELGYHAAVDLDASQAGQIGSTSGPSNPAIFTSTATTNATFTMEDLFNRIIYIWNLVTDKLQRIRWPWMTEPARELSMDDHWDWDEFSVDDSGRQSDTPRPNASPRPDPRRSGQSYTESDEDW